MVIMDPVMIFNTAVGGCSLILTVVALVGRLARTKGKLPNSRDARGRRTRVLIKVGTFVLFFFFFISRF